MCEEKIKEVVTKFAKEAKKIYGASLCDVILYGSCARGDYAEDSDIDIMILMDVAQEEIGKARRQIVDISDQIDLEYDVVLAPVIQNYQLYQQYMPVSRFYQNVQREGVRFACGFVGTKRLCEISRTEIERSKKYARLQNCRESIWQRNV